MTGVSINDHESNRQNTAGNELLLGVPEPWEASDEFAPRNIDVPLQDRQIHARDHGTQVSSVSASYDSEQIAMPDADARRTAETTETSEDGQVDSLGVRYDDTSVYIGGGVASSPIELQRPAISRRNPKAALKEYYDQCEPRVTLTKASFVSITDNAAGHHVPSFTSIFVCPRSGEIFLSGSLLNTDLGGDQVIVRGNLAWYKTKANSQFAAAGRALDCFHVREEKAVEEIFCDDVPYRATDFIVTVNYLEEHYHVPRSEIEKVQALQKKASRFGFQ